MKSTILIIPPNKDILYGAICRVNPNLSYGDNVGTRNNSCDGMEVNRLMFDIEHSIMFIAVLLIDFIYRRIRIIDAPSVVTFTHDYFGT